MRSGIIGLIAALALASPARAEVIFTYDNGKPVGHAISEEFEFYQVDVADIHAGNAELLNSVLGYGPQRADIGYGSTEFGKDTDAAEHYGRRKGGLLVNDVAITDYLSPGDWQGIYGDYYDPGTNYFELDKSGPHWSFDSQSFYRFGYVYGLDDAQYIRDQRRRRQHEVVWRRGSMDGGVWMAHGLMYEVNREEKAPQPRDVKLKQLEVEFISNEDGLRLNGGVFTGKYQSQGADIDNTFIGGKLDGDLQLTDNLALAIDGSLTDIDAKNQHGTVVRSNAGATLAWELANGLTLSGLLRTRSENSDIAANSHVTGVNEYGGELAYRYASDTNISLSALHRDVDTERLKLEDDTIFDTIYSSPAPTRADWAGLRVPSSASADKLVLDTKLRLTPHCLLSGTALREVFDTRPPVGNLLDADPQPSYFAHERTEMAAALRYDLGEGANVALRAERAKRNNSERQSEFESERYSVGFSSRLTDRLRWDLGFSRNDTSINLPSAADNWGGGSWNYHVTLAGDHNLLDYKLTYNKQLLTGAGRGDYDSLGLELTLDNLPIYVSAWWRERGETLGGLGTFDDSGVNIGYHITLK